MSSNWVSNLDMLAAGGVIDFDAAAYLLDQPARFVGNPRLENLPLENPSLLPEGTKLKDLPKTDEFNNSGKKVAENPSWKKWTFGAIAAAIIAGGIFALSKGKIKMPKFTSKIKMPDMTKFKTTMKNIGTKTLGYIKQPFIWIASKFKKKP